MRNSSLKLAAGKLLEAWRQYPQMRRSLAQVSPGPPIFITGTHRSGTTWVAAMLAVSGIWYIHEPFSVTKGLWRENFTYVPPGDAGAEVDAIMQTILHGGHREMLNLPWSDHPLMPLRLFPQWPKRVLLKDPLACLMSAYLTRRFGLKTVVLFRHPAGFVSSMLKLGWPCAEPIRRFLENKELMQDWLAPNRAVMEKFCREDNQYSAAALCGCLNRVLWGYINRYPEMRPLIFEDLCNDPLPRFQSLFLDLGLPYDSSTLARHRDLCLSEAAVGKNYRTHDVMRNSREMANRWRNDLDKETVKTIRNIWDQFEIPLYSLSW